MQVDVELFEIMPKLQILLDTEYITFSKKFNKKIITFKCYISLVQ